MEYLFLLSGENIKLAAQEVLSLLNIKKYKLIRKLLFDDIEDSIDIDELTNRLALTKSIQKIFPQEKFYAKFSEKSIAGYIWGKIKNPKVNLDSPKTLINLFFNNEKVYCFLLLKNVSHDFEKRKSHLRPRPSPTSLHPRLARAMVNLTGIKDKNETIADLFCGSGGIPLEAGLMGFKTVANDINKKMLWKTLVNLRYYKIKDCRLMNKDILKISEKFDYAVSDLPYGLNSSIYYKNSERKGKIKIKNNKKMIKELENFYLKILLKLKKIVKKKIVLIFPHFVNYKKIIRKSGLKLNHDFGIYVHKSLTRRIVVLSP